MMFLSFAFSQLESSDFKEVSVDNVFFDSIKYLEKNINLKINDNDTPKNALKKLAIENKKRGVWTLRDDLFEITNPKENL